MMRLTANPTRQCRLFAVGLTFFAVAWITLAGCAAFGLSAGAALIRGSGITEDRWLANIGTLNGTLCFLAGGLAGLPRFRKPGGALRQSPS